MTKQIKEIQSSWTWKHKHLIVTLSLVVVILWQNFAPDFTQVITYRAEAMGTTDPILLRAEQIYKEREPVNREHARLDAIEEAHMMLLDSTRKSPYIDYDKVDSALQMFKDAQR